VIVAHNLLPAFYVAAIDDDAVLYVVGSASCLTLASVLDLRAIPGSLESQRVL